MMNKLLLFALLPLFAGIGKKLLSEIPGFQRESYFKTKVYSEHDATSFFELKEAQLEVDPTNYDVHLLSAAVFFAVNKLRESKNLKPFTYSEALRNAAAVHTWQMVSKNFFSHYNNKNRKLHSPENRIKLFKANAESYGENCDMNSMYDDEGVTYLQLAKEIVTNLYNSPPHRKIMLSKDFRYLGCFTMFELKMKDKGVWYCKTTQNFSGRL
ncbi:MAG: CAP domain-containing protein [Chitinophagales bacterium]|nr:CAP domain-containing protein [Chitinophagales bacterium]